MEFLQKQKLTLIGIALGAIAGYAYYAFIGCDKGCTITGSPLNSTVYGMIMGGLLLNIFQKDTKGKTQQ